MKFLWLAAKELLLGCWVLSYVIGMLGDTGVYKSLQDFYQCIKFKGLIAFMMIDNTLAAFHLNFDLETKGDLSLRSIVLVWKDLK